MSRLVIVSNRVTLPGSPCQAGGLAVALESALKREGGLWCGWSGVISDSHGIHRQEDGPVRYRTLDYTQGEYDDFYLGFCNSQLWPLFHYRIGLSHYSRPMHDAYKAVNDRFADLIAQEAQADDRIWVHDYHFLPLGQYLRRRGMRQRIGFFLHTPFPAPEVLRISPAYRELLEAMCAYDVLGFQTGADLQCFLRCVRELCGGRLLRADDTHVEIEACGRRFAAAHVPVSIDTGAMETLARRTDRDPHTQHLHDSLAGRALIIGVDRLDYSKGLLLRLEAYRHFIEHHPEQAAASSYLQITPPSRADVEEYRELRDQLEGMAAHINGLHATVDHTPIRYLCQHFGHEELAGLYRMAKVGLVTPLRDGMNLVAKEYVACQDPSDPGVLVLSEFAGAAQELDAALLINPHDAGATADAIREALAMPLEERRARHGTMMSVLRNHTVHDWAQTFLARLDMPAPLEIRAVG